VKNNLFEVPKPNGPKMAAQECILQTETAELFEVPKPNGPKMEAQECILQTETADHPAIQANADSDACCCFHSQTQRHSQEAQKVQCHQFLTPKGSVNPSK